MSLLGAAALVAVLAIYAAQKRRNGRWGEMLFGCHVASAILALGVLVGSRFAVASGAVFFAGVGIPAWLVRVVATRTTTALEVATHVLPIVVATPWLAEHGIPRGIGLVTWGGFLVLQLVSRATDPALNVNLAHGPSPELARLVRHPWAARALVVVGALLMLTLAELALARLLV